MDDFLDGVAATSDHGAGAVQAKAVGATRVSVQPPVATAAAYPIPPFTKLQRKELSLERKLDLRAQ
jgi:hypothetical protein